MVRSSICKMKLFAHNPRQFTSSPVKVPQSERNIVFANVTKLLEYVTLIKEVMDKYMWQIGTSSLWNAVLCLTNPLELCTSHWASARWKFGTTTSRLRRPKGWEPSTPDYINANRLGRRPAIDAGSTAEALSADPGPVVQGSFGSDKVQSQKDEEILPDFGESYDFLPILSFEMDPNEWVLWEQLVVEQGGFA
ncbi:hypothetical protein V1517DRAFT_363025 [Lipomyces orientalis]|uniref:Uncharacterized protein n=1 Tax=Lipomyces orientalis TaxID=1233043 RepID=A0ACC3TK05_9ASCO